MTETLNDPFAVLSNERTNRTPRSLETRGSSERRNQWVEPQLLPDPAPRDGWRFKWIRTESRGQADKNNASKRFREGWEPVRAEDHPEILDGWNMPPGKGTIEFGGLMLCKMPEEMVRQRQKHYHDLTMAGLNDAEEHYMRDSSELVKKFKENRSRKVFGR